MTVDTKNVANRRELHFSTLNDTSDEVERLVEGPVQMLGNWSFGQILAHLATAMNASIDGAGYTVSWYFRIMARMIKGKMLRDKMRPGFKLPKAAADVLIPPETSTEDGLVAFRTAIKRQQNEPHREPNAAFGPMTPDEWEQLFCRHAELHLSFVLPADGE